MVGQSLTEKVGVSDNLHSEKSTPNREKGTAMKPNSSKSMHCTALVMVLPFLVSIPGAAIADPGGNQNQSTNTSSLVTGTTIADSQIWHWHSDPEAYQPDGLSDYSEDFNTARQQTADRSVARRTDPHRAAGFQEKSNLSQ